MQELYLGHHKPIRIGPFRTSDKELIDLTKAWIAISLAFTLVSTGFNFDYAFIVIMVISAVTVGLGFLLHELGHKIMAQHYGCFAEFRSSNFMLLLGLILAAFVGILFAAPGAVMIAGPIGIRRNGIISMSGPLVNYVLAVLFLILIFIFPSMPLLVKIGMMGFWINSWLGLFNMIPFGFFDGAKILAWDKVVYAVMLIVGITFVFGYSFFTGV